MDFGLALVVAVILASEALVVGTPWGNAFIMLLLAPAWVCVLANARSYASRHVGVGSEEYRAIGRAGLHLFALVAAVYFLTGSTPAARALAPVIVGLPVATVLLRKALRTAHFKRRVAGAHLQRAIVVGHWGSVEDLVSTVRRDPVSTGLDIVGVCTDVPEGVDISVLGGLPVHGSPTTALQAAQEFDADVVAIASHPDLVGHSLRRLSWALEARDIDLIVAPGIVEVAGPRLSLRPAAGLSMLHVERPLTNLVAYRMKLLVERVLAALTLVVLLPVTLGIAALIKSGSDGPVFFKQWRIGAGGEMFQMYKFRTMVNDAEKLKESLAGGNETNAVLFKLQNDPRVTRIGKVLRRFSIDELPQLINVVKGEMSLIGPRPPLPDEVQTYESDAFRRLRLLPGMTGLWQVNGRSLLSWDDSLRMDLWYVDNWSVAVDLQIIVRTFRAVLQGRGAF